MPIKTSIVTWGPEEAVEALATTARNRTISQMKVRQYQNDMAAGRWQFTGEPIQFDTDGHLINGQHRLAALAGLLGTDLSISFLIIRGLPTESQMVMDQGRLRVASQQLQMRGVKDATIVSGGVRLYLGYQTGLMFRDNKVATEVITTAYIEQWVEEHQDLVEKLSGFIGHIKASDAPPSISYCAAIMFTLKNEPYAREFFRALAKGSEGEDSPITVLDKRLQRHRREGILISRRDALGLYVQAWNAWRRGDTLTKFQRPRGGHWTEATFPKPIA